MGFSFSQPVILSDILIVCVTHAACIPQMRVSTRIPGLQCGSVSIAVLSLMAISSKYWACCLLGPWGCVVVIQLPHASSGSLGQCDRHGLAVATSNTLGHCNLQGAVQYWP